MQLALDFMTEQANMFNPEWRAEVIDDTISAESGDSHFNAIVSVTGTIIWVFAFATDTAAVEATGYWNPADFAFLGSVSAIASRGEQPSLFAMAGRSPSLWEMVEQIVETLPVKTGRRMEA